MRWLSLVLLLAIAPSIATAEVSPPIWLNYCLDHPIPDMNITEQNRFVIDEEQRCMTTFISICDAVENKDACISIGTDILKKSYDQIAMDFPDFSVMGNPDVRQWFKVLSESRSSEINIYPMHDCGGSNIECEFATWSQKLINLRHARRRVIMTLLLENGDNK